MLLFAVVFSSVCAGTVKWTGIQGDTMWHTPSNWYPAAVPVEGDDVVIDDAQRQDATVLVTNTTRVRSLAMGSSSSFKAHLRILGPGSLTVDTSAKVHDNGMLEINNGGLLMCQDVTVTGYFAFLSGTCHANMKISGVADFGTDAAKAFKSTVMAIDSVRTVLATGTLTFDNTTVTSISGMLSHTKRLLFSSAGDAPSRFTVNGFSWSSEEGTIRGSSIMAFSAGIKLQGVDYIAPAQECVLPLKTDLKDEGGGEVARHEKGKEETVKLQLADCLACSGCVTTAETMLVQEQSLPRLYEALEAAGRYQRTEVGMSRGDAHRQTSSTTQTAPVPAPATEAPPKPRKLFAASLSPQSISSIAALYRCSSTEAYARIVHAFKAKLHVDIVVDLLWANTLALHETSAEVLNLLNVRDSIGDAQLPLVTSACPGLVCHAEKRESHLVDHLSHVQSAQTTFGKLLKSMVVDLYNKSEEATLHPADVYHVSVQPCYDRKLEASRKEHQETFTVDGEEVVVKCTDLVIATHELHDLLQDVLCFEPGQEGMQLTLQDEIRLFRDSCEEPLTEGALFGPSAALPRPKPDNGVPDDLDDKAVLLEGSGGYAVGVVKDVAKHYGLSWELTLRDFSKDYAAMRLAETKGQEGLLVEKKRGKYDIFTLIIGGQPRFKAAIANGFHLITSLTKTRRGRKDQKYEYKEYDFVELMACGGGCGNGQGQVRPSSQLDARELNSSLLVRVNSLLHELLQAAHMSTSVEVPGTFPPSSSLSAEKIYSYIGGGVLSDSAKKYLHTTFSKLDDANVPAQPPTLAQIDW